MNFRMTDLSNFATTATCRTMSEASKRLGITQPSLSQSIKKLEQDLGTIVFYRSRTGIQLTPGGRRLLEKSKNLLTAVFEIDLGKKNPEDLSAYSLVVGCHPVVGSYVLPKVLDAFEALAPKLRIELRHGLSRQIQLDTQSGSIDISLVVNPVSSPDLVIKKIADDEVCVWASPQKYNHNRLICNLDLFQTQAVLRKWKKHPSAIISSESLELIARLTHQGIGFGILPARAVALVGLPLKKMADLPSFKDEICVIHRPEFGRFGFEKIFIETLKKSFV